MKLDGDYLTVRETAILLGIHTSRVLRLCQGGMLDGAVKLSGIWMIPAPPRRIAAGKGPAPKTTVQPTGQEPGEVDAVIA